jgi:hypothetical protein
MTDNAPPARERIATGFCRIAGVLRAAPRGTIGRTTCRIAVPLDPEETPGDAAGPADGSFAVRPRRTRLTASHLLARSLTRHNTAHAPARRPAAAFGSLNTECRFRILIGEHMPLFYTQASNEIIGSQLRNRVFECEGAPQKPS